MEGEDNWRYAHLTVGYWRTVPFKMTTQGSAWDLRYSLILGNERTVTRGSRRDAVLPHVNIVAEKVYTYVEICVCVL